MYWGLNVSISPRLCGVLGGSPFQRSMPKRSKRSPPSKLQVQGHFMASETKSPLSTLARRAPSVRRIAQLAEQPHLAAAQKWFTRERTWINDIHVQVCRIPAATFFE